MASLAGEARILDAFGPTVIAELRAGRTLIVEDCLGDPRVGDDHAASWAEIGCRALGGRAEPTFGDLRVT